jgi:aminopeptidase N
MYVALFYVTMKQIYRINAEISGFGGAVETHSLTTVNPSIGEDTIVHEMGHVWFGNAVHLAEWGDVWLHEGFATYMEALWIEATQGPAAYNEAIQGNYDLHTMEPKAWVGAPTYEPVVEEGQVIPPVDQPIEFIYRTSYYGGALLLHNLRMEVGDEIFFEILPTFFQRFKDAPVTTEDFIATAEEVSGRDLSDWAAVWLYATKFWPISRCCRSRG